MGCRSKGLDGLRKKHKTSMADMIRYYSTNRGLHGVDGIRPFEGRVSFREALLQGQAPDEGLFMPDRIPPTPLGKILECKGKPYREIALLVSWAFLEGKSPGKT